MSYRQTMNVFILEDSRSQRFALHESLDIRGFNVYSAGNVTEARFVIEMHGSTLDVVILDMRIEDPSAPRVTGVDLGQELLERYPSNRPEFLFHSAHDDLIFYQAALRLGAAAYLRKGDDRFDLAEVVRHVRGLALRRAIHLGGTGIEEAADEILDRASDEQQALNLFCREYLAPQIERWSGCDYVLLVADDRNTRVLGSSLELGNMNISAVSALMALAATSGPSDDVISFDRGRLQGLKLDLTPMELEALSDAVFMPLTLSGKRKILLGLKAKRDGGPQAEDPRLLARIIRAFVPTAVMENLLQLIVRMGQRKEHVRNQVVRDNAAVCIRLSASQQRLIEQIALKVPKVQNVEEFIALIAQSEELRETGERLGAVSEGRASYDRKVFSSAQDAIQLAWRQIRVPSWLEDVKLSLPEGICKIPLTRDQARLVTYAILQWMVSHAVETRMGTPITVSCREQSGQVLLSFEDGTRRVMGELRRLMFDPAATPVHPSGAGLLQLYQARVLVEARHGKIMDRSDELKGDLGHRFVIQLPAATV